MRHPVLLLLGIAAVVGCRRQSSQNDASPNAVADDSIPSRTVNYTCADSATLTVRFARDSATITLPGQTPIALAQVVSASGAKYADVSYTLQTKGDEAFLEQNGAITRRDCLAKPPE